MEAEEHESEAAQGKAGVGPDSTHLVWQNSGFKIFQSELESPMLLLAVDCNLDSDRHVRRHGVVMTRHGPCDVDDD